MTLGAVVGIEEVESHRGIEGASQTRLPEFWHLYRLAQNRREVEAIGLDETLRSVPSLNSRPR